RLPDASVRSGPRRLRSYLGLGLDRVGAAGDRLGDGHPVVLLPGSEAGGHGARVPVLTACDEGEGDLRFRRVADLLAEAVVAVIDLDADTGRAQLCGHLGEVVVELIGHGNAGHLDGGEPDGERTGV